MIIKLGLINWLENDATMTFVLQDAAAQYEAEEATIKEQKFLHVMESGILSKAPELVEENLPKVCPIRWANGTNLHLYHSHYGLFNMRIKFTTGFPFLPLRCYDVYSNIWIKKLFLFLL